MASVTGLRRLRLTMRDASENGASPRVVRTHTGRFARRLAVAFAIVAFVTAALAAGFISVSWNVEFDRYLTDNLQHMCDGVADVASQAYAEYSGWTLQTLSLIPKWGPVRGIAVQILDTGGKVVYDDTTTHIQDDRGNVVSEQQIVIEPEGPIVTAPVLVGGQEVGTVRLWAFGVGAGLTDRDVKFRDASVRALAIAALVATFLASIAGMAYASRLVRPIERITATARALRGGDSGARTGLAGEDEIAVLGRTVDEMADAIEADRELERRLTADVAHELRTPLQAIQATVEAMQDGVLPADEERLGTVRDETVRLARLADAILELTRLERGSLPFEMNRLDLAEPVRAAADAHEALFDASGLAFETRIAAGIHICGDRDRLQQAVSNLLSNAARYTPEGGAVTLCLRRGGSNAVIEVDDTGIGVSDDDLPHLFSRFWRADSARDRSTGGLGIGLAVTKEIVERHDGSIRAERLEPVGTRFTITVPLDRSAVPRRYGASTSTWTAEARA